ncbi:MAG: DUF2807 domain-containing protein, partial [Chitinophagaceae bacterium]|nr:DUF2807 domain-containing protein [Chitinophagaceae bacterium]
ACLTGPIVPLFKYIITQTMKKLLMLLAMAGTCTWAAAQTKTYYEANTEKRTVGSFTGIDASAGVEVLLTQGAEYEVAVAASDAELLDRVRTDVVDGILRIYVDVNWKLWKMPKNWKVKAYVSFKQLETLRASSGASIKGEVNLGQLKTHSNSGGFIVLSGKVSHLDAHSNSGGMMKGYELAADYLKAEVNSGGGVQVTVLKEVEASANSGGFVTYKGEAVIKNINVNSGGSVKRSQ